MSTKIRRVFVVEDHPMFRETLGNMINSQPDMMLCGETDNATEAVLNIRKATPDLIMVDLTLRGSSGLNLVKTLRALGIPAPILVLSMHEESLYAERVIRAGANGYITKYRETTELLRAMQSVLAGEIYLADQTTAMLEESRKTLTMPAAKRSFSRLTDREIEVLRLISLGKTTREIAAELSLGIASIDTYRARIKEKLGLRNGIELQRFAMRCFSEDEDGI